MKVYGNRFATIEQQPDGSWIVFNEISGLPVYEDADADYPQAKLFPSCATARAAQSFLTERAKAILRGGDAARFS